MDTLLIGVTTFAADVLLSPIIAGPVYQALHENYEQLPGIVLGSSYAAGGYFVSSLVTGTPFNGMALTATVGGAAANHATTGRWLYWPIASKYPKVRNYLGPIISSTGAMFGKMLYDVATN
mgnify:FL=1